MRFWKQDADLVKEPGPGVRRARKATRRTLLIVAVVGLLAGLAILQPGRAAAAPLCQVVNTASKAITYTTLQDAVNAATAGDTLKVTGTCTGSTTIAVNLTIEGDNDPILGIPTLVGSGSGTVVTIQSTATVTIRSLVITGGVDTTGGGIHNAGMLTINHSTVENSKATSGGGIYSSGTLTLDNSTVTNNLAFTVGGGIYSSGTLNINRSTISLNRGINGGGGIYNSGTGTIDNTTASSNNAAFGGGIYNSGTLTVKDSTVSSNNAISPPLSGGGIFNNSHALLTLDNTTVSGNHGVGGGGILNMFSGTVTLTHSTVTTNTATSGGGIYNNGTVITQPLTFTGNTAIAPRRRYL